MYIVVFIIFLFKFSDNMINPPMTGPNGLLIPLRNNAAGKMTGFEVITRSLITEYFPQDIRTKGFNVHYNTHIIKT